MTDRESTYKILLVEDDKIDQMAFERFVKQNNLPYKYKIVGSINEATAPLQNETYDVILMDYMLGDGTGFDLLPYAGESPVIFITGGGNELVAVKAIKQGAFDYLIKDHERNYLSLLPISIQKAVDHKLAQLRLAETEKENARLSWLLSNTDNSVMILDAEGKIKWVNDGFVRLTGYSLEEVVGTSGKVLRHGDNTGITKGEKQYNTVYEHKKSVSYEAKNYTKDGREYWAFTTLTPMLDHNGRIIEVIGIDADITKRKKVEQELRESTTRLITLLDNLIAGVIFADKQNNVLHVNRKYCEIFHVTEKPSNLNGASVIDLEAQNSTRFDEPDEYLAHLYKIIQSEKTVLREEVPMSDGATLERSYIPIKADGEVKSHLWIYSDITERKQTEQDLIAAKQEAERSSRAKQDFLANISHEIRTPMNAIIGLGNLLMDTELNDKQQQYMRSINFASDNLLVLINDILDLAKIEAGKITFEKARFNLREVISGMIDTVSFKIKESDTVRLDSYVDENIPSVLEGDPVRLNQILMNIVGNAVKFTEEGEINVSINQKEKTGNKVVLEFVVEDTGIGIPKDQLSEIFDAFKQANMDTTRKFGGTGLGLAIVKQLIDLQHGAIVAESEVGKGSKFTFELPFEMAEKVSEGEKDSEEKRSVDLSGVKVLLVEDNELNQMLTETFLKKWNVEVEIADNGRIAVEKVENNGTFDLILMDIQMPEMDGYEATEYIRKKLPAPKNQTPILAMTAHAFRQEEQKCLDKGMNAYVSKPLKPDTLRNKMIEVLAGNAKKTAT